MRVEEAEEVIGWCDILPRHGEARAHVGTLGMGLIASARHQGLGTQLISATLDKAKSKGMTRIELTVRVDNRPALALYERFGFKIEAQQSRSLKIANQYIDAYAMALLC
ncbi:N-acetyltransferase family protein [Ampullimonas aquatilis]|uniref:GNAT family N-acetyltransferase n=1 Tax=Ampullimonas aquatilis TaxID=1341549 RepID=UPI003C731B2D